MTLDTTRADHLGCYGGGRANSPNIDRLAFLGTLFTRALSSASVTPVAHASIFTGLYPYQHGLRVLHGPSDNRLGPEAATMAEVFQAAGYATAALVSAFPAGSRFGLDQGFDLFDEDFLKDPLPEIVGPDGLVNIRANQRRADATSDRALAWLERAPRPGFLWLHYFDPHDSNLIPPEDFLRQFPPPKGDDLTLLRQLYDLEIRFLDHEFGRLLDALSSGGELDDWVIVVVSDHGQGLGDHGWWTHGLLYEEQIRVALIIQAPGVPGGRRLGQLVRTVDILPTVIELAGLDPGAAPPVEGKSLLPMMRGDAPDTQRTAYADSVNMLVYRYREGITDHKDEMLFAVTDGRWKYIHHLLREKESELYDLESDPQERRNLARLRPGITRRLLEELKSRDFRPPPQRAGGLMSEEDIQRLQALGYLR